MDSTGKLQELKIIMTLTANDIEPGRCYEAKKPKVVGVNELIDDRQVIWVDSMRTEVQYDSITVARGGRYPEVSMKAFLKWVGRDITALMPKGKWRRATNGTMATNTWCV